MHSIFVLVLELQSAYVTTNPQHWCTYLVMSNEINQAVVYMDIVTILTSISNLAIIVFNNIKNSQSRVIKNL